VAETIIFEVQDVDTLELEATRHTHGSFKRAQITCDAEMLRAHYTAGSPKLELDVEYRVVVEMEATPDERIATFRARVRVRVEASRDVVDDDVEAGNLQIAQNLGFDVAHPVLRNEIRTLSASLGMPPLTFPVEFKTLRDALIEES
jgi:hypothetical protein